VPSIFKEFPAPSVDNPALLRQYVYTLAEQYRQRFSALRGFAVEVEDRTAKKNMKPGWELRILHGTFGGATVVLTPIRTEPRVIQVETGKTSRAKIRSVKVAAVILGVIMIPLLLGVLFAGLRLGFALILLAPVFFILAAVLSGIAALIGNALGKFDKAFSENSRQMILKMVEELPLPDKLQGPTPPPPMPNQQTLNALPERKSGIWPLVR